MIIHNSNKNDDLTSTMIDTKRKIFYGRQNKDSKQYFGWLNQSINQHRQCQPFQEQALMDHNMAFLFH